MLLVTHRVFFLSVAKNDHSHFLPHSQPCYNVLLPVPRHCLQVLIFSEILTAIRQLTCGHATLKKYTQYLYSVLYVRIHEFHHLTQ